jgi:uncharacterized protein YukE
MILSTILACQERIRHLQKQTAHRESWSRFNAHVVDVIDADMLRYAPAMQQCTADIRHVESAMASLDATLDHCYQDLQQQRERLAPEYERLSQEIYRGDIMRTMKIVEDPNKSIEDFWNIRTPITPEDKDVIRARLDAFNDWRIPGVIIRPGLDDWIDCLVALDPLYLVDMDRILLRPALARYPKVYQQRVRQYAIDETQPMMMRALPMAQMGVIFCYDFFRARPLDIMQKYFQEIWQLLRPGGVFLFTYGDGDRSKAVALTEHGANCHTPSHVVRGMWQDLGFETVFEYESDLGWNYAEIRRPGSIKTLRGGQSLAKIRPIH